MHDFRTLVSFVALLLPLAACGGDAPQSHPDAASQVAPTRQILDAASGIEIGDSAAPVTLYELSDFQCPACRMAATEFMGVFKSRYVDTGRVRWVFIDFPLPMHPHAIAAATAARCAYRQDSFLPYHDVLFMKQATWAREGEPREMFIDFARGLDLDEEAFRACIDGTSAREEVLSNQRAALAVRAPGTPTFFVNGQMVSGAGAAVVKMVDAALAEAGEGTSSNR